MVKSSNGSQVMKGPWSATLVDFQPEGMKEDKKGGGRSKKRKPWICTKYTMLSAGHILGKMCKAGGARPLDTWPARKNLVSAAALISVQVI